MSSNLFNENMTTNELRMTFFRAVEGKTEEERALLFEEYDRVRSVVFKKEMDFVSAKAREGIIVLD